MTTRDANPGPNVHLPISFPAELRARLDAEAAERKCTRASIVLAALSRWYGVEDAALRPTGASHRERILRFAAAGGAGTFADGAFTYTEAAEATGLKYADARLYVLQLADAGRLECRRTGTPRTFRLADAAEK